MNKIERLKIENINTPQKAGLAVRRLRKLKKMSQAELAKIMQMRQPTVSDIESGKGTLESFFKIIRALKLNLEISTLVDRTTDKKSKDKENVKLKKMLNYLNEI